ncbi:hypothetical protein [Virgibacillus proomii]|jgi:hypothetical protein|uniref:hypothetical protein n=1 Tax=Virgibacillus proomii TaxID=84407 RepID=UPI000986F871|nr:hypothetical protein [Virgibacillus proomii]
MRYLNEEELTIASRFLFLSMTIIVIQQDIHYFQKSELKLKDAYIGVLKNMEEKALQERRHLRKVMLQKQIKVMKLDRNDSFSSYLFLCQGREEKRNYFNPAIRKKVKAIFLELMQKSLLPDQDDSVGI